MNSMFTFNKRIVFSWEALLFLAVAFVVLVVGFERASGFLTQEVSEAQTSAEIAALPVGSDYFETGFITPASCNVCTAEDNKNNCTNWQNFGHAEWGGACEPPPPVNGVCGTNNGKVFPWNVTSWNPVDTFCSAGSPSPAGPAFPPQGGSTNWTCLGAWGGSNASCSASRDAAPLPDITPSGVPVISGTLTTGGTVVVDADLTNVGAADIAGSFGNLFQIDYQNDGSWNDYMDRPNSVTGLNMGQVKTVNSFWTVPVPGTHAIRICGDSNSSGVGTITESDEGNNCSAKTVFIVVDPVPTADIKADGSDVDIVVPWGSNSTISWSSTNAATCNITNIGAVGPSGSQVTGPYTGGPATFTITCDGPGGTSAPDSVTVSPGPPPQCVNGIDDADPEDVLVDAADPGCHTDGDPTNPGSYDPTDDDETDVPQCSNGGDDADPEDGLIDANDPGCHTDNDPTNPGSYDPNDDDETDLVLDLRAVNVSPGSGTNFDFTDDITFDGRAENIGDIAIAEGGWADVEIDWDSDGSFDNYNAFGGSQLGAMGVGATKNLTYTFNGPLPVGTHRYRFNVDTDDTGVPGETNESNNRSAWVTFTVDAPADPTATIEACDLGGGNCVVGPGVKTIDEGDEIEITWSSSNADTCLGAGFATGGATSGTQPNIIEPPSDSSTSYTVSCDTIPPHPNGPGWSSVTVTTNALAPVLIAIPGPARFNQPVDLVWDTTDSDPATCTLSGPGVDYGLGELIPDAGNTGTETFNMLGSATYVLDCGANGTAEASVELIPGIWES